MSLIQLINEDMKTYMKEKNTNALDAVRMLKADIKSIEIDSKKELSDEEIIKIVQSTIKKNKEAAEIFQKAGRQDLVDKENAYTAALNKYMPKQLTEKEIEEIAKSEIQILSQGGNKPAFGAVIKAVMAKTGSSADGKTVSAVIKKLLG